MFSYNIYMHDHSMTKFPFLIRSNSQGVILLRLTTHMLLRLQKLFCLYLSTYSFAHKVVVVVKLTLCGHAIHSREVSEKLISTQTFMTSNKWTCGKFIIHCFISYFEWVRIWFLAIPIWYSSKNDFIIVVSKALKYIIDIRSLITLYLTFSCHHRKCNICYNLYVHFYIAQGTLHNCNGNLIQNIFHATR